ncbi:MAG TPA: IclR family transcriptional regulator C-terminal domain-containing protein [Candidatus Sulfotelmatobacter sp.]|nr:IclR family transcriptional regulator C-terminal domain-containing protein [Candidatus Sulfotelmatobacter sp.]
MYKARSSQGEAAPAVPASDYVQSLAKGLAVIRAFGTARRALSLSEVAVSTGLTRAGARRLLLTLESLGYVVLDERRFRPTPKILELGFSYLASLDVWDAAQPWVEQLVAQLGETCTASVLDGEDIVCVLRVPTGRIMNVNFGVGRRLPASACAMGRVLLAGLSEPELARYFAGARFPSYTEHTVTDPQALRAIVERARTDDYALVDGELEVGLRSLAIPLRDTRGRTTAAMTVCIPGARASVDDMLARVLPAMRATRAGIEAAIQTRG